MLAAAANALGMGALTPNVTLRSGSAKQWSLALGKHLGCSPGRKQLPDTQLPGDMALSPEPRPGGSAKGLLQSP